MECTECNLITGVLTFYHVRLAQSTALEQKCFGLRSSSPALCNLWLLLVYTCILRHTNLSSAKLMSFLFLGWIESIRRNVNFFILFITLKIPLDINNTFISMSGDILKFDPDYFLFQPIRGGCFDCQASSKVYQWGSWNGCHVCIRYPNSSKGTFTVDHSLK